MWQGWPDWDQLRKSIHPCLLRVRSLVRISFDCRDGGWWGTYHHFISSKSHKKCKKLLVHHPQIILSSHALSNAPPPLLISSAFISNFINKLTNATILYNNINNSIAWTNRQAFYALTRTRGIATKYFVYTILSSLKSLNTQNTQHRITLNIKSQNERPVGHGWKVSRFFSFQLRDIFLQNT